MGKDEDQSGRKLQSVLFVCTGNIFRSVTAEYALKADSAPAHHVLCARPGSMPSLSRCMPGSRPDCTRRALIQTIHAQRQLSKELAEAADLVMAMG